MKIGVIADDFTGASDIALPLSKAGMRVVQYIGIPGGAAEDDVDAGVISLKSRTSPVTEAVAAARAACAWFLTQGAEQIVFKVCSTFDSTPTGNIGAVLDALADDLGVARTIICPAFPENGRSVYQGHLFVGDHLLSESGMQHHPLTPMTDPDLRRVLATQCARTVGHVRWDVVQRGADAIYAAVADQTGHLIVDAIRDADLLAIGLASRSHRLLCGGSGIALGLPALYAATRATAAWQPVTGPGVVLWGSCSRVTRGQVAAYQAIAPSREITARDAIDGLVTPEAIADWVLAQSVPPLVYASADPEVVRAAQATFGSEQSARARRRAVFTAGYHLGGSGATRIVVAGGETSGAVVSGLGAQVLHIWPKLAAGVPLVRVAGPWPLCIALKSGNFGQPDFFATTLRRMEELA